MKNVALYDDPLFREHDSGEGHPERPERLEAIRRGILEAGLEADLRLLRPRPATPEELLRVHTPGHLSLVASTRGRTHRFDPDTQAGPRSYEAALLAAGAVLDAVDRVLAGDIDRAFCVVRPPGHHALADTAMGFCLFNNVAVGAAHALARGLERIAIIDFDVHHGNGTQALFYNDPRVLYVSSHAYPFYPGTGSLGEVGEGPGKGFTVNLPMPQGSGDVEYAGVYRDVVAPVGRAFEPDLVLVSAGFDAHRDDPLANMGLTEEGFAAVAETCLDVAAGRARGRAVFALEGGYDLSGLSGSAAAVIRALLGGESTATRFARSPALESLLGFYRPVFTPYWPVLGS